MIVLLEPRRSETVYFKLATSSVNCPGCRFEFGDQFPVLSRWCPLGRPVLGVHSTVCFYPDPPLSLFSSAVHMYIDAHW